jgi:hypothetical protein
LVKNGGFDGSMNQWSFVFDPVSYDGTTDADGCPGSGALLLPDFGPGTFSQCVKNVPANISLGFGFRFKGNPNGTQNAYTSRCSLSFSSDPINCGGSALGDGASVAVQTDKTTWVAGFTFATSPPGTVSASIICGQNGSAGFYDQFYLSPGGGTF